MGLISLDVVPQGQGYFVVVKENAMRSVYFLLAVMLCFTGCNKQDKEIFSSVGRKIAGKLEDTTAPARKKVEVGWRAMRGGILEGSLEDAILFRFKTDKELHQENIEVIHKGDGVVLLKGELSDLGMKGRAIALANTTKGVDRLEDELSEKKASAPKEDSKKKDSKEEAKGVEEPLKNEKKLPEPFKPFDPIKEKGAQDKPAPPVK